MVGRPAGGDRSTDGGMPPAAAACECDALPGARWLHTVFHDCVDSPSAAASSAFGWAAVAVAAVAQLPQVVKNWRQQGAARALSPLYLLGWLVGDLWCARPPGIAPPPPADADCWLLGRLLELLPRPVILAYASHS